MFPACDRPYVMREIPRRMPGACRELSMLALLILGLLLAGCADDKPKGPSPEELLAQAAKGGYTPAHHYGLREVHETWRQGETEIDVTLLSPDPGSADKWLPRPLVVYLPGLGESATDGTVWRRAWAQAGYAVLALQLDKFGPKLWSTQRAFAGEFSDIAQEAYSESTMARRLQAVAFVLDRAQRRSAADRNGNWYIDYKNIALAGFDYGAQTAAVAAGARIRNLPPESLPALSALPRFSGLLLLSPYPGRAGRWDYSGLTLPVLSITGAKDGDPYGLFGPMLSRGVVWRGMPDGGKYQLLLATASHTLISGVSLVDPLTAGRFTNKKQEAREQEQQDQQQQQRRRRRNGDDAGQDDDRKAAPVGKPLAVGAQVFDSREVAAILAVSTAYLDTVLGNEHDARAWLHGDGMNWIAPAGQLEVR